MRTILFLFLFFFLQILSAQPQILHSKIIKSDSIASLNRIVPTSDGNFYVSGYVTSSEKPHYTNAYFAKIDEKGNVLWEKKVAKTGDTRLSDFVIDKQQHIVLIIRDIVTLEKQNNYFSYLQKWDSLGNILMEISVNEEFILTPPIEILPTNELLIGIQELKKINDSTTNTALGLAKFDESGTLIWKKTFECAVENRVFYESSFLILPNQQIVFAASNGIAPNKVDWHKFRENTQDISLIFCTENGEEISRKELATTATIETISPTSDGDFLVLGSLYDKAEENADMYVAKISVAKTEIIWEINQHFYKSDAAHFFFETSDNHYVISGACSGGWLYNTSHSALFEIDNEGKTLWTRMLREGHFVIDGFQKADGSYFCTGIFSERFAQNDESLSHKIIPKNDAMLLSLSQNACIWEKNLAIPGKEQAYCLEKAKDKGYFISGIDFAGNDIFLFKIDENGEFLWRQELGDWSASMEVPVCLAATEEGGCLAMNNSDDLFSFSKNGIGNWNSREYNFKNIAAIISADKKNFVVAGSTWKEYPDKALWIGKINEKGKKIWEKEYDLAKPIEVWDMAKTQDEGFVITGESGEIGSTQFALIKVDANGKLLWEKNYPFGKHANAKAVIALKDGGYAIGGIVFSPEKKYEAFILKTDAKGELLWSSTFVKSDDDVSAVAMTTDLEGNILFAANHEYSNYKGDQEIYVCKLDLAGKILWEKAIGGGNSHYLGGISLTTDNQIIVVGYANYFTHGDDSNIYIAKIRNE